MTNINLNGQQRRNALRQLVVGRGPDAGRQVGHLKLRSLSPDAEQSLLMAEGMGLSVPAGGTLGGSDGVYFLVGWSSVVGSDVL